MLAVLLATTACCLFAFGVVVLRADPKRWDNQMFAGLAIVDGLTAALRALVIFDGHTLWDLAGIRCASFEALIGWFTIEFAYSFPFSTPAPRWLRAVALTASLAAGLALGVEPEWAARWIAYAYFMPVFAVTVYLLVRNYQRVSGAQSPAVRTIMIALGLRWASGQATYVVAKALGHDAFAVALTFDSTAAVLACMLAVGWGVCTGHLFRVRGLIAELFLYVTFFVAIGAMTFASVEAVLAWAPGPTALRLGLFVAALLPLHLTALAKRLRGGMERVVLGSIDPRRAVRAAVLERALRALDQAVAPATLDIVREALAEITLGGRTRFLGAAAARIAGIDGELDPALAAELAAAGAGHLVRGDELVVAVPAGGRPLGALVVTGGQLDRDSLLTAASLGNHLAVKLENESLVAQLEESRRLATLGSFAAAIAHDIRTPLTSVQMNVQILRGKADLPADDMEHFDIALDELKRLNLHIAELLDYAKPVRLSTEPLEPRELADDAARAVAPLYGERAVAMTVEHDDRNPPVVADAHRMRQVLVNLLDNAARASSRGAEVVLRTAVADDGRVALEVRDRGKGIEPADLPRIFEPFFTTRPDGTGLGLAIVHKLVRAHHGEIQVRSTPGEGSTFTVLLPAAR
jgi:signal transduction histidine kinase